MVEEGIVSGERAGDGCHKSMTRGINVRVVVKWECCRRHLFREKIHRRDAARPK